MQNVERSSFARVRPRRTYANVAATLALVLALGGGAAYALFVPTFGPTFVYACANNKTGALSLRSSASRHPLTCRYVLRRRT
jgi:hypothetical protein